MEAQLNGAAGCVDLWPEQPEVPHGLYYGRLDKVIKNHTAQ